MTEDTLNLDLNDLTIAEISEIEELSNLPFDAMSDPSKPKGRLLQAMAYVSKKRLDPNFTFEMAGALKLNMTSEDASLINGDE
jgi:hypothetical protein